MSTGVRRMLPSAPARRVEAPGRDLPPTATDTGLLMTVISHSMKSAD